MGALAVQGATIEKNINFVSWTPPQFLQMCILAGCDYLPSLPGLGIKTAFKLVKTHRTIDNVRPPTARLVPPGSLCVTGKLTTHTSRVVLLRTQILPVLAARGVEAPADYRQRFEQALLTFRHQRVWNTQSNSLQPLTPFPADADVR